MMSIPESGGPVATELLHEAANGLGDGAADARIHLVKKQRLRCSQPARGHGDCKCDARQLTA